MALFWHPIEKNCFLAISKHDSMRRYVINPHDSTLRHAFFEPNPYGGGEISKGFVLFENLSLMDAKLKAEQLDLQ